MSIGLWCNGNTADSGPAFPGSSPGSPTESFSYTEALFVIKIKDESLCKRAKAKFT